MPGDARTNALDDLLDAERHFRSQAEIALRELRSVLSELAERLAGLEIEDARRADPAAPENWGAEAWRKFFARVPMDTNGNLWNDGLLAELERLKTENQALKEKLVSRQIPSSPVLTTSHPRVITEQQPANPLPDTAGGGATPLQASDSVTVDNESHDRTFAHTDLLRDLRALRLPSTLPARFQSHFPKVCTVDADWERQVRRKLYALYLLSQGMDIRLEIDHLISHVEGVGSRSGALRRGYDSMVERNLISREVLEMSLPNTSLAMLELSEDGRQLCQILGWDVAESERQRLIRLHQGALYPQHTLGVMIFAMHARFRGYRVGVLPKLVRVQTNAIPDVSISRDLPDEKAETIYAEVELSTKELDNKWRNLAELQSRVALCARNSKHRTRLVGDCKLKDLHGVATDLETLIACKVPDISQSTPLWAEEW